MAIIINDLPSTNNSGLSIGTIILVTLFIIVGSLGFAYGLPLLQQM